MRSHWWILFGSSVSVAAYSGCGSAERTSGLNPQGCAGDACDAGNESSTSNGRDAATSPDAPGPDAAGGRDAGSNPDSSETCGWLPYADGLSGGTITMSS